MAVIQAAQRRFDIQALEEEIVTLERELREGEYAERLANNPDWTMLAKQYRSAMTERTTELDGLKEQLFSKALAPDKAIELREWVMLLERDRMNAEDFLGYPVRLVQRLKEDRQVLDARKDHLRRLKGEDHG